MHDRKGNPLSVGDHVVIEATVRDLQAHDEYCNITVETVEPMYPGENKSAITLNAKQVTRTGAND